MTIVILSEAKDPVLFKSKRLIIKRSPLGIPEIRAESEAIPLRQLADRLGMTVSLTFFTSLNFNMNKTYFVYIMTNHPRNTVLYTGVTNNVDKRVEQHQISTEASFTKKYNVNKVVYVEEYSSVYDAIAREKQIKSWTRAKKVYLIKQSDPLFQDGLCTHLSS